jgi:hypothetical protein
MNVIFLDIDGYDGREQKAINFDLTVGNCPAHSVLQANDTDWFSMTGIHKNENVNILCNFLILFLLAALKLLRELVRHTDAKIVLSSTWRLLASTRQVSDINHLYFITF